MKTTGIESPKGVWWKPADRNERIWFTIAFVWCMVLFAMMPFWHLKGGQNPTGIRARVEPDAYRERVNEFIESYRVGTEDGTPVVEPPPGSHVYLMGVMWQWTPILRLQKDVEYILHLSSVDVNHGFNLYPFNVNFQVVPGYDYALRITPTEAGEYGVVCNEFCGVGHHLMVGKVYVDDPAAALAPPVGYDPLPAATDSDGAGDPSPADREASATPDPVNAGGDR